MTHDPLCEERNPHHVLPGECVCDLIVRVREDEAVKRRADLIWQDGYDIAMRDAVDAVTFRIHDLTNCMKNDDCHILARGAELALSDIQALLGGSHE